LRLGPSPLALITSTPKPTKLCREIEQKKNSDGTPAAVVTIGKTADNRRNLSPVFFEQIITRYQGSRLGLQELEAEILDDNPYALFKRENIERDITETAPPSESVYRIIVAVDPAITANAEGSTHNGIIVLAEGKAPDKVRAGEVQHADKKHYYVLEDAWLIGPPEQWGTMARMMAETYQAGTCLYEDNQGGLMVKTVLQTAGVKCGIKGIHAVADKGKRALNASLISAQGRLHLVRDSEHPDHLADLEGELTTWIPGEDSPDRMDALVHGINHCEETSGGNGRLDDDALRFFHGRG
jgi:phage terminase large subunit-like protein